MKKRNETKKPGNVKQTCAENVFYERLYADFFRYHVNINQNDISNYLYNNDNGEFYTEQVNKIIKKTY